jgi:hypothetical protein
MTLAAAESMPLRVRPSSLPRASSAAAGVLVRLRRLAILR